MTTYTEAQVRANLVAICNWGISNHTQFTYSEGPKRMVGVKTPFVLPMISDCSAWITKIASWCGIPDPNGVNYNGTGYTGTLLSHNTHITKAEVLPGDVVVYGPGTGWHTAMIVSVDSHGNLLSCSMGQNGDPSLVWVCPPVGVPAAGHSVDNRKPQTFLRLNLNVVDVMHTPPVAPVKNAKE
jgi:hypothetical protein